MEDYPRWFVDVSRVFAPQVGTVLSHIAWRGGYLKSKQAAQNAILSSLQPLDIVLVSSKGRTSGQLIPGLFGHAAIYLGTQSQMQDLGVWTSAAIKPHAADVENGKIFIEADQKGVHLSPASIVLNTDRVAILRPEFSTNMRRREIIRDYFRFIGADFDFLFDVDSPDCTFCTELIHRVMPELDLSIQDIYGVRTIIPDRVAVAAIRHEVGLSLVGYIKADLKTWRQASGKALAEDIAVTWFKRQQPD
ncbi:MAG: YiiX/YebB-like N1pC/P60 family cysteine hydrolase [Hoeflea sp.]|uniref:YiiX/YebB-like N1pC/P60 family cysteine hydrolase n=1 Tax=Hoeflea sp. TaxID=1940281 RepID=UPI003296A0C6